LYNSRQSCCFLECRANDVAFHVISIGNFRIGRNIKVGERTQLHIREIPEARERLENHFAVVVSNANFLNSLMIRVIPTDAKDTCNSAHEAAVDIRCIKADMVGLLIHCRHANIMGNQELHRKFKRFCDNEDDRARYMPRSRVSHVTRHSTTRPRSGSMCPLA